MANVQRALLALGEGLGQFASMRYQQERDAALAAREENLVRLRATLEGEQFEKEIGLRRELGKEEIAGRKEMLTAEIAGRREIAGLEHKQRSELAGREENLQRERWSREDLQKTEQIYEGQLAQIDNRTQEVQDMISKARLEGTVMDESVLEEMRGEIKTLKSQREGVMKARTAALTRMGDKRTSFDQSSLDEALAQEEAGRAGSAGRGDRPASGQEPKETGTSIKVTKPPAEPEGMKPRKLVRGGRSMGTEGESAAQPRSRTEELYGESGGKTVKRLISTLGEKTNRVSAVNDAVRKLKSQLAKDGSVPPELRKELLQYTQDELERAGLSETQLRILRGS